MRGRFLVAISAMAVVAGCGGDGDQRTPYASAEWADVGKCHDREQPPDGVVLATGLLSQSSTDPVISGEQSDGLSREIDGVLEQIRKASPVTEDIHAQADFGLAQVSLGLEPNLLEALSLADNTDIDTGYPKFDTLNDRLGLIGWRISDGGFALLCFNGPINVLAAATAYEDVDGVRSASANGYSYILIATPHDIEVFKDGDTWYLVLRRGSAGMGVLQDPSTTTYFFAVSGDTVMEIPRSEANSSPVFTRLAEACAFRAC